MSNREPIQYIEIDVDTCSLTWGSYPCGARFGLSEFRTNLFLRSQELDNAYWTKDGTSIGVTNLSAPDGTTTAESLVEDSSTGPHRVYRSMSYTNGVTYTLSAFVRRQSGTRHVQLASSVAASARGTYDLDTVEAFTGTFDGGIQALSGGWFRIWLTVTATSTGSGFQTVRISDTSSNAALASYTGDGTSSLRVWGMQFEVGTNPGPYLPTTTVEVTAVSKGSEKKCFNTFATCTSTANFTKTTLTQRFIQNRITQPKGLNAYPAIEEGGISSFGSTVNLAGANERMGAFGRRATVSIKLKDFPTTDRWFDPYVDDRKSGVAQSDGIGYDPYTRGTYFGKLKQRWPYYAGKPLRIVDAYITNGAIVDARTRHYVITNIIGNNSDGSVTIEGKDVLTLAEDDKALYPAPSRGKLSADITDANGQSFSVTPAGIGAEYPASGYGLIGSEVVSFTRSSDVITLTGRGLGGTSAVDHFLDDTFQEVKSLEDTRVDDFLYDLLVNHANIDPAFIPTTDWEEEVDTWLSSLLLNTFITKPTGVTTLINELGVLGMSIWWDDVDQEIKLLANRPFFNDTLYDINDDNHIKDIKQDDLDEDRLTQIHLYSVQTDVTKGVNDKSNYDRILVIVDTDAEGANAYNDTKIREVFCRYFNQGADNILSIAGRRLLKRFNKAPAEYSILLDAKDRDITLGDVLNISSYIIQDDTGLPVSRLAQVFRKVEKKSGHEIELTAQAYRYTGQYGRIAPNSTPDFSSASDYEKGRYCFIVDNTGLNSDGTDPNTII